MAQQSAARPAEVPSQQAGNYGGSQQQPPYYPTHPGNNTEYSDFLLH